MRKKIRLIVLAGALLWSLAMPVSGALAASSSTSAAASTAASTSGLGNPLQVGSGVSQAVTLPATTPVTTSSSSSGGFNSTDALIIAFVAVLLIVGVGFYVWFDARQHVPRGNSDYEYFDSHQRKGSKAPQKSRKLSAAERKRRKRGRAR